MFIKSTKKSSLKEENFHIENLLLNQYSLAKSFTEEQESYFQQNLIKAFNNLSIPWWCIIYVSSTRDETKKKISVSLNHTYRWPSGVKPKTETEGFVAA